MSPARETPAPAAGARPMTVASSLAAIDTLYAGIPVFAGFDNLMEPTLYKPVPDDWIVGMTDVVDSTPAIAAGRYKVVNTVGAAAIAAVGNRLGRFDFPYAFGGDGASFTLPGAVLGEVRLALAQTAAWARDEFGLALRGALVPVSDIRAHGVDVRVARFSPSPHVSYAMFSGGGLAFAEREMKAGRFAVQASGAGERPDLSGLSCRWNEIPSERGVMLSVIVVPAAGADMVAFRELVEDTLRLAAQAPGAGSPLPAGGPTLRPALSGIDIEARVGRRRRQPLNVARMKAAAHVLAAVAILRAGRRIGGFSPARYLKEVVQNTDFRKYDDGLRMTLDCSPALADAFQDKLERAAADGIARYGLHRQKAALMTCIVPSPTASDHVHFIDGASGGYAAAAKALKDSVQPI